MKILMIETSTLSRDGIRILLEKENHKVTCLEPNQAELKAILDIAPDLVMIMPDDIPDNAVELVSLIKKNAKSIKVCYLTAECTPLLMTQAIKNEVDGLISRSTDTRSFLELLANIQMGVSAISPNIAQNLFNFLQKNESPTPKIKLTRSETNLLQLVSQGLTNKQIAEDLGVTMSTVKFHLKSINKKIGARNRMEAIFIAIKLDLIAYAVTK